MSNRRAPQSLHVQNPQRPLRMAAGVLLVALLAMFALAAPASAMKMSDKATPAVQKWESPQSFSAPYAFIDVKQHGRSLPGVPITACRVSYVSKDITVMVSTCGSRWRVKARYVSMSGHNERFDLVYEPRSKP